MAKSLSDPKSFLRRFFFFDNRTMVQSSIANTLNNCKIKYLNICRLASPDRTLFCAVGSQLF